MRSHLGPDIAAVALAALLVTPAQGAGPGLALDAQRDAWPRWAARLHLTTGLDQPGLGLLRTRSMQLLGDYYLDGPRLGDAGGLRLTSGVLVGPRGGIADPAAASGWRPRTLSASVGTAMLRDPSAAAEGVAAWPYVGVGYSAASLRGGWGFSADLGLAAQNPSGLRLAGVLGGAQSLDDALRELRLRPLVQVGVSYAF